MLFAAKKVSTLQRRSGTKALGILAATMFGACLNVVDDSRDAGSNAAVIAPVRDAGQGVDGGSFDAGTPDGGRTGPVFDAGTGAIGDPCKKASACQTQPAFCIEPMLGTGWPDGYCTTECHNAMCPESTECFMQPLRGTFCVAQCDTPDQGRGKCRMGYLCVLRQATSNTGVCIPDCRVDPANSCWNNTVCNQHSGYCQAPP